MPGPSNWTTAFTHPDPMDPNDRVRQKTQSRDVMWPYDRDNSYGASSHAGMDGSERQDGADDGPPLARVHRAPRPMSVWDRMSDAIDRDMEGMPYLSNGPETELSAPLGYGNHGRMGEDGLDALELEMDAVRRDFVDSYNRAKPATDGMDSRSLFKLLGELDPDFAAETFAPDEQDEMRDIYACWASRAIGREE